MIAGVSSFFARLIPAAPAEALLLRLVQKQMLRWWLRLSWWLIPLYAVLCFLNQSLFLTSAGGALYTAYNTSYSPLLEMAYRLSCLGVYGLPGLLWLLSIRRSSQLSLSFFDEVAAPRVHLRQSTLFRIYSKQGWPILLLLLIASLGRSYVDWVGSVAIAGSSSYGNLHSHAPHLAEILAAELLNANFAWLILALFQCWLSAILAQGWRIWLWQLAPVLLFSPWGMLLLRPGLSLPWQQAPHAAGACAGLVLFGVALGLALAGRKHAAYGLTVFMLLAGAMYAALGRIITSLPVLPRWVSPASVALCSINSWPELPALRYGACYLPEQARFSPDGGLMLALFNRSFVPAPEWTILLTVLELLLLLLAAWFLFYWLARRMDQREAAKDADAHDGSAPVLQAPPPAVTSGDMASS